MACTSNHWSGGDRIQLQGMRFFGYHGVLPEERTQGQFFEVDAELFCSLEPAAEDDELNKAVDYSLVYQNIREIVEGRQYRLIETLAARLAESLLARFPIEGVRIRVRKPEVPLSGPLAWAGVEISRWRKEVEAKRHFNREQIIKETAYVALGSNLGDREAYLWQALGLLAAHPSLQVQKVSSFYETEPVGYLDQGMFLNAVAQLETDRTPQELLKILQAIENRLGRQRGIRWGPRTIDLDLLLYGNQTIEEPELIIPHPRMLERDFVLVPLAEIAPDLLLPDGRSLKKIITQSFNTETTGCQKLWSHVKMDSRNLKGKRDES